jgi:excinuclease UvrABC nuclease subunit
MRVDLIITKEQVPMLPERSGVYALLDENSQIIYIGKSINLNNRLYDHVIGKKDKFSFIQVMYESEEKLDELEKELTKKYKPKLNKRNKNDHRLSELVPKTFFITDEIYKAIRLKAMEEDLQVNELVRKLLSNGIEDKYFKI